MIEQLDTIQKLIARSEGNEQGPHKYLVHAIFYTMDIAFLSDLFIQTKDNHLKKSLDSHLSKRFNDGTINLKSLFSSLFRKIQKAHYLEHQRIRILLTRFVGKLPKSYIQKYFNYFSSTRYAHDLSAALNVSNLVWNSAFDDKFISEYIATGNVKYLDAVLTNGKTESIIEHLEEIWDEEPYDYIKNRIIRKIAPTHFHVLGILKDREPDKYLYASGIVGHNLHDKEARRLMESLKDYQKPYGLWCLGKLGKWNLLKEYLEEYIR
jgi:hypothetical protein